MTLQGMQCPKCGSRRLAIVASGEPLMYKCLSCGHAWNPPLAGTGMVNVARSYIHWTEIKRMFETAIIEAKRLFQEGLDCGEVVNRLVERFGGALSLRDLGRSALMGVRQLMEEVKFRDRELYSRLLSEVEKCRSIITGTVARQSSSYSS